ncbi:single-stranded DNA-binding protein [Desulfothermobacter acidiphilus]|uniref:single-stranded DNA-binding protein n=1 Tax=Desulfothermobacter acidiphilus TaxID=1938353 RepID=UPI003F88BD83
MLNRVILIGRLVRDPELRYTSSGTPVGGFTVAVDRPGSSRQAQRQTDFIDVVVWSNLAEICHRNLTKGRLVAVEGRLQIRSYDDSQGIRRRAAEVVADNVRFLDRPRADAEKEAPSGTGQDDLGLGEVVDFSDDDGDIPF